MTIAFSRALLPVAFAIAATGPVLAQAPAGCVSLVISEWEWVASGVDPGEPTYRPDQSAVRFVPPLFVLTGASVERESGEPVEGWYQLRPVRPAPEPTPGFWRIDPIGLRITWSGDGEIFEARFSGLDPEAGATTGQGGEASLASGQTHDSAPAWIGTATLVKRSCTAAGGL